MFLADCAEKLGIYGQIESVQELIVLAGVVCKKLDNEPGLAKDCKPYPKVAV